MKVRALKLIYDLQEKKHRQVGEVFDISSKRLECISSRELVEVIEENVSRETLLEETPKKAGGVNANRRSKK